MNSDLLLEIAWKSAAVMALALVIVRLMRHRSPAECAWIAHAGLLMALLTPVFVIWGPNLEVVTPWNVTPEVSTSYTNVSLQVLPVKAATPYTAAPIQMLSPETLAMIAYGLVGLSLLVGLGVAIVRLFILQRRADVLVDPVWLSALAHAQHRMGFKHGAALLVSRDLQSPVSWGLLRPSILLNPTAVASGAQAEAVIAHELAHVMRLDWANLIVARLTTAVFWYNPLVWLLAAEAHQRREEAADDAVLRGNVEGTDYASLLIGVARHENRGALLAANGVAPGGKNSLKRRLTRVLDLRAERAPMRSVWVIVSSLLAMGICGPLAALTPVGQPTAPPDTLEMQAGSPTASVADTARHADLAPTDRPAPKTLITSSRGDAGDAHPGRPEERASAASARLGRGDSSVDLLMQMSLFGVTPEWAESLGQVNPKLRGLTRQQLIELAGQRVTADKLNQLEALGYRDLDYEVVLDFAMHKVTPAYIQSLQDVGYRHLSADELIALKIHRVTPDYVRRIQAGGMSLDPDDLPRPGSGTRRDRARPTSEGPPGLPPQPPRPPAFTPQN